MGTSIFSLPRCSVELIFKANSGATFLQTIVKFSLVPAQLDVKVRFFVTFLQQKEAERLLAPNSHDRQSLRPITHGEKGDPCPFHEKGPIFRTVELRKVCNFTSQTSATMP